MPKGQAIRLTKGVEPIKDWLLSCRLYAQPISILFMETAYSLGGVFGKGDRMEFPDLAGIAYEFVGPIVPIGLVADTMVGETAVFHISFVSVTVQPPIENSLCSPVAHRYVFSRRLVPNACIRQTLCKCCSVRIGMIEEISLLHIPRMV